MWINNPALRLIDERVGEVRSVVVDRIDRCAYDCAWREVFAANCDTTWENLARSESSNRGSHPQCFLDAGSNILTRI
jgi:hypothetical protein